MLPSFFPYLYAYSAYLYNYYKEKKEIAHPLMRCYIDAPLSISDWAYRAGFIDFTDTLLEGGRDEAGNTLLMAAIRHGSTRLISHLLKDKKIDIDAAALDCAKRQESKPKILNMLLQKAEPIEAMPAPILVLALKSPRTLKRTAKMAELDLNPVRPNSRNG